MQQAEQQERNNATTATQYITHTQPCRHSDIQTLSYRYTDTQIHRYRWKLRSIWMCRCKHMLNWIEIEFAILCAAANAIFFAVREAPSRMPSHLLTSSQLFVVFLFYLPWGAKSPDMVMNLVCKKLCPLAAVFDSQHGAKQFKFHRLEGYGNGFMCG